MSKIILENLNVRLTKENYDYYHVVQLATGLQQQVDVYRQLLYGHLAASKWQAQVKTEFHRVSYTQVEPLLIDLARGTRERERERLLIAPRRYTFQLFTYFKFFYLKEKNFGGGDHYYLPRPTGKFHNLVMPISPVIWLLRSGIYKRKKKVTLFLLFRYIIK